MKQTAYFIEQVRLKRPYVTLEMCELVINNPLKANIQEDGRMRIWGKVLDERDGNYRILRIVLLEDKITLHNAFFDRNFKDESE